MAGTLYVVGTPIGNLEDITLRALRVLREVDLIAAEDTRRTAKLLAHFEIPTRTTSLHEHNEHQKVGSLLKLLAEGRDVALVSDAGTPTVSDPGNHVIQQAAVAGITVVAVPGPSAITTALASSGFDVSSFRFLGFAPGRANDRKRWLEGAAADPTTQVFFESPHRIRETLAAALGAWGDRQAVVARELTKVHEELVRGPISVLVDAVREPKGEYTVVVEGASRTKVHPVEEVGDDELLAQFWLLTKFGQSTRRSAIAKLARRHGLAANLVYERLERAKIRAVAK